MKINTKLTKGNWIDYEDGIRFCIRPYPSSMIHITDDPIQQAKDIYKMYDYCLVGWEGLETEDGKPYQYNNNNKKYIYDYYMEIRDWIIDQITTLMTEDRETKN